MVYRFSPIKSETKLFEAINYLHIQSNKMCKQVFGRYLANAGNVGVFCHSEEEYEFLVQLRKKITYDSTNPNQKYFMLKNPIVLQATEDIPITEYKYLYIRKPRDDSPQVGDIDFYLQNKEFYEIKQYIKNGNTIKGARIYDRADLDMIELFDLEVDVLAYVSTLTETQKTRVKQSEETIL